MQLFWHDWAVWILLLNSYTVLVISVIRKVKQNNALAFLQKLQTVKVQRDRTGYCNHQNNVYTEAEIIVEKIPQQYQQ